METYPEITQLIELVDNVKTAILYTHTNTHTHPHMFRKSIGEHEHDKRDGSQKKDPNQISRDEEYSV